MADKAGKQDDVEERKLAARIGVVICECGDKIAGVLDTDALLRRGSALPGVVYTWSEPYPCSRDGQDRLRQAIFDNKLNRILIAGCTPRLVEKLFRRSVEEAGLDGDFADVADIREQCAYVHAADPAAALEKAAAIIAMGVARLAAITPRRTYSRPILKSAVLIGSGLSGLTVALALADAGITVALVERAGGLGGSLHVLQDRGPELIAERVAAAANHSRVQTLLGTHVKDVGGQPGGYELHLVQGDQDIILKTGVIVVATEAQPTRLDHARWYDRSRVVTQTEFAGELGAAAGANGSLPLSNIVMVLSPEETQDGRHSRLGSAAAIRQAIQTKHMTPDANITILFRDFYLGGEGDPDQSLVVQAQELGVTLFRYHKAHPPAVGEKTVDVDDPLTGDPLRIPFDRVVLTTPLVPSDDASELAALLRLPRDRQGFILERRTRLRPGHYADDGIYVVGGAHQPCDSNEALFQAHVASARILRFLTRDSIEVEASVAEVDKALCTGCGSCAQVCPTAAITLEKTEGILSLAVVDALRCTACGNCAVVCPVKAISLPGWGDSAILAQISAALSSDGSQETSQGTKQATPKILVFACEWSAYAAADIAGSRRVTYPSEARILRMNCSARFDPYHMLWAFLNGANGVFLGVCPQGECHYRTGNLHAEERVRALRRQLADHGIDPRRLRLEFMAPDDGLAFAAAMKDFKAEVSS
jgi:heterodisulfide reductase subunit A